MARKGLGLDWGSLPGKGLGLDWGGPDLPSQLTARPVDSGARPVSPPSAPPGSSTQYQSGRNTSERRGGGRGEGRRFRASTPRSRSHLVEGAGLRVQGSGCRVQGAGFRVQGAGCRVQGSGFNSWASSRTLSSIGAHPHTPCTLHPAPCTLHPAPCILHPATYSLHSTPYSRER